jgi:lipopolysaccharide/colanic/teichoic acid biosynthesis glycosyltransferase
MNPKRLFDLCATVPGLMVLAPLLAGISLWIKLDSPGPVLFKQIRVGRLGRPFQVYKFRSMVADAATRGLELTTGKDLRITRAGRFLRRFKLDELPQLFNVVKGEMSLVGPRPEVPRYVALYPEAVRGLVLSIPPGITDRASIEFRNENSMLDGSVDPEQTYIHEILPIKLGYYAEYARQHTTRGDVLIILRTIAAIFL